MNLEISSQHKRNALPAEFRPLILLTMANRKQRGNSPAERQAATPTNFLRCNLYRRELLNR